MTAVQDEIIGHSAKIKLFLEDTGNFGARRKKRNVREQFMIICDTAKKKFKLYYQY